ncbi:high mobility group protein HMG-I/HMG-Y isoform X2 [Dendrobates tinctorius]|uniref:high mobility group protein HMG-I/HMG-Y isoform X2 n=1 Tax=Dendrobates tinctorius TaxID=92724 RepID=UPI003CC9EA6B
MPALQPNIIGGSDEDTALDPGFLLSCQEPPSHQPTKLSSQSEAVIDSKESREPSGSPTTKRPRGRPKGSTKKGKANQQTANSKKSESGKNKAPKKQADDEDEGGTAEESSEDQ